MLHCRISWREPPAQGETMDMRVYWQTVATARQERDASARDEDWRRDAHESLGPCWAKWSTQKTRARPLPRPSQEEALGGAGLHMLGCWVTMNVGMGLHPPWPRTRL